MRAAGDDGSARRPAQCPHDLGVLPSTPQGPAQGRYATSGLTEITYKTLLKRKGTLVSNVPNDGVPDDRMTQMPLREALGPVPVRRDPQRHIAQKRIRITIIQAGAVMANAWESSNDTAAWSANLRPQVCRVPVLLLCPACGRSNPSFRTI